MPDARSGASPPDPREQDIMAGDRRLSRPDASLPDWHSPDTHYRPVPIVWFTGAVVAQTVAMTALFILFSRLHGAFTIAACAFASALIGRWAWERGLHRASAGWRTALVVLLSVQFVLVGIGVSDRL